MVRQRRENYEEALTDEGKTEGLREKRSASLQVI